MVFSLSLFGSSRGFSLVPLCSLVLVLFCPVMCLCKGRWGSVPRRVWRAGAPFLGLVCQVCVCGTLLMVAQHCTQLSSVALKHKKLT